MGVIALVKKNPRYPFIGESTVNTGLIVYFTDEKCGVILKSQCNTYEAGSYQTDWNMQVFKKITGEIVLSNE